MSVSVFVPSYNHAKFIERTLRSIFAQTLHPAKLLVIDDGSRDESVEIIERVLTDCPFPSELIARENRGLCRTLNEGLAKTEGGFFAYLGSDDIWYPEFLAERIRLLEKNENAVLAYGHADLIDGDDRLIDSTPGWRVYGEAETPEMLLKGNSPISSTVAYRRAALEKTGWNENARLEDYELYLQLTAYGDFVFDRKILSAWRKHSENTSRDRYFLLEEVLAAQKRVGPQIGLSVERLDQAQTDTVFTYLEIFAREGDKKEAWKLLRENFGRVPSLQKLGKLLLLLAAPDFLLRQRKKRELNRSRNTFT
jgi:alpha-1,3-rhamnosyltransferase